MAEDPSISPALAEFFGSLGLDPASLTAAPGASAPTSQADIAAMALQSALALSQPYGSPLPWWAQGLRYALVSEDQFPGVYKANEGLVYMDTAATQQEVRTPANKFAAEQGGPYETTTTTGPKQDYALTVTQAMNLPYTWDQGEVADAMDRMKAAGLQVDGFDSLVSAWQGLVNRAATTYSMTDGKRKLTPWDVLDLYKDESKAAGTFVDPNRTETQIHRSVTEVSEGEAWASIQGTLSQMLGRDPTDQETRDFTYRMNRLASTNPQISKTVAQYKNGELASTTTHTDPGFTAADMAEEAYDDAQSDPDYAEYRAGSYYFNALMSALGPIGG